MPVATESNPLGVNVPQGGAFGFDRLILNLATDPAGNAQTIAGMTTANPTVITTSAAHGFISGQTVNVNASTAFVATGTVPNGNYVATVLSATTFSIPFNYTGTYTSGGAVTQQFQPGQLVRIQSWNGTASGAASTPAYPTVSLTPLTTASPAQIGVILGGNVIKAPVPLGGVAQICVSGICQAYFDTTSTLTNFSASVATPGTAKPLTATTGLNIGVATQAVTVTNAYQPQLAYVFVKLS